MPAYILFTRESDVRDAAEMQRYVNKATAIPNKSGAKPLVIYGHMEALEGKAPHAIVLLEFASPEDAKAWYHSPEYQAAAAHRKKAADFRVTLVEGI
ncbi:MAG TPA: DUF1330 domain-containing protein [Steroidobacteraceae bacterium]|nr:DUF1330 domain-containing protein [Steroidobacteraceae bacterium]